MKDRVINKLLSPNPYSVTKRIPKFLATIFSMVVLQKILNLKLDGKYDEFLFKLGKSLGKTITAKVISSNSGEERSKLIPIFLKEFESLGFGQCKVNILNLERGLCIISNITNPISKQYKRTFGIQKKGVDFFLSGLYSGCLSSIMKKDCFFIEKDCISKGSSCCVFYLDFVSPFKKDCIRQEEIDSIITWKNIYSEYQSDYPNELIQKIIQLKQIQLSAGELKVWNVYCVFFPIDIYLATYEVFRRRGTDLSNELCYLGIIQAKIAILFQVNKFGIKNGIATFSSIVNQLEFFGAGKGELVEQGAGRLVVRFKDSYAIFQYKSILGDLKSFNDIYVKGIITGAAHYAFERKIASVAQAISGNNITYIFRYGGDKSESIVEKYRKNIKNKKIVQIIEERMKHKYYLLA